MVLLEGPSDGGSSYRLNAASITAAVLHTAKGYAVVTYKDDSNAVKTRVIPGQDGIDLYNALVAIAAASLSTTT